MNLSRLFIPWPVLDKATGAIIQTSACNSSFACLEAARLTITAAESNVMLLTFDTKRTYLGNRFVATHLATIPQEVN